jgi:hypothetical protein
VLKLIEDLFDPIIGAELKRSESRERPFQETKAIFMQLFCFYQAKQVRTVGNKNMCPCAYQKGIKVVYKMRRETREKMDQADMEMENRWKVSPPKRKQKKKIFLLRN